MWFNKILNMPITSVSRCRVYNNSTSFMASTYFNENGSVKNAIVVDTIKYKISNSWGYSVSDLYYNEDKEMYIIKQHGVEKMYYLLIPTENLKYMLRTIEAKSTLTNQILTIKKAEYKECRVENGYILFDMYDSFFSEDITEDKLSRLTPMQTTISAFEKNNEGKYEYKDTNMKESQYFINVGNVIIHKRLYTEEFLTNFLGFMSINDMRTTGRQVNVGDSPLEYKINKQTRTLVALINTDRYIGVLIGNNCIIRHDTDIHNLSYSTTDSTAVFDKTMFTDNSVQKVIDYSNGLYANRISYLCCTKTLDEIVKLLVNDNIFRLFEV